jgi:hypothetical protein
MPPDIEVHRDLGRHDAEIGNLKKEVHAMREDLSEIKQMLSEAKGGWRVLMAVSGLAATVASGFTWFVFKVLGLLK